MLATPATHTANQIKPGLNYKQALQQLRKVGCAHATGDALRAMYADLLSTRMRGADPARIYAYLGTAEGDLLDAYRRLCDDVWAYTDALLTEPG